MHYLNTLLKLRQGQGPGTPLRSFAGRPRLTFQQMLGVKHPITNYSTLSNHVHLARSRPAECPLPCERPFSDSSVNMQLGWASQPRLGRPSLVLLVTLVVEKVHAVIAHNGSFKTLNKARLEQETLSQVTQHTTTSFTAVRMTHTH